MSKSIEELRPRRMVRAKVAQSQRPAARKSNFLDVLVEARKAEHRSVPNLAKMAGVAPSAIRNLEDGKGPVATLLAVMEALPFQVTGLAPGRTFAEQLLNRRVKKGISIEAAAAKASLPVQAIVDLENGRGSMQNLLRLMAVIAPKVRRRAPERAHWGQGAKADRDSRFTPPSFMVPIYDVFGEVDLDPCGHLASPVVARRRFILANGDDGLTDPWSGRFAFVNPPFSAQLDWVRRAYEQWEVGNVKTIACLVPARVDSAFFHETVILNADIYVLQGRVRFLNLTGKSQSTPFSLMLVVFGATAQQKARFASLVPGFWISVIGNPSIAATGNAALAIAPPPRNIEQFIENSSRSIVFSDCGPGPATRVCCRP